MTQCRAPCAAQLWFTEKEKNIFNRKKEVSCHQPHTCEAFWYFKKKGNDPDQELKVPQSRARGKKKAFTPPSHLLKGLRGIFHKYAYDCTTQRPWDPALVTGHPGHSTYMLKYVYFTNMTLSKVWGGQEVVFKWVNTKGRNKVWPYGAQCCSYPRQQGGQTGQSQI